MPKFDFLLDVHLADRYNKGDTIVRHPRQDPCQCLRPKPPGGIQEDQISDRVRNMKKENAEML